MLQRIIYQSPNTMKMREIKFRSWDGEMMGQVLLLKLDKPSPFPLMQFTGLKDKHGREIYEGDIVEFKNSESDNPPKARGSVVWGSYGDGCSEEYVKGVQCWMVGGFHLPLSSIEHGGVRYGRGTETDGELPVVIGNVHQNPELLA